MEAARSLNYKPRRSSAATEKANARRSSVSATNAIGFQFFSAEASDTLFSNSFYGRILAGAQTEAAQHGFHLLIHTTKRNIVMFERVKPNAKVVAALCCAVIGGVTLMSGCKGGGAVPTNDAQRLASPPPKGATPPPGLKEDMDKRMQNAPAGAKSGAGPTTQ